MNTTILIITHSGDHPRIAVVEQLLRDKGLPVVRFNVDKYLTEWTITSVYQQGMWQKSLEKGDLRLLASDIRAVWFRRMQHFAAEALAQVEEAYRGTLYAEAQATFLGFLNSLDACFYCNHPHYNRIAESKETQLNVASQVGLRIPPTCISNDPLAVQRFAADCGGDLIAKMHSVPLLAKDDGKYAVYTSRLKAEQIAGLGDELRLSPMIFQAFIPKVREYRALVIGSEVFVAQLDTHQQFTVDWRRDGEASSAHWQKGDLPVEIKNALLRYARAFQLSYGAADLVESPTGEFYFLEMNPGGEFDWVNALHEGAVCRAIARVLSEESPTLQPWKNTDNY